MGNNFIHANALDEKYQISILIAILTILDPYFAHFSSFEDIKNELKKLDRDETGKEIWEPLKELSYALFYMFFGRDPAVAISVNGDNPIVKIKNKLPTNVFLSLVGGDELAEDYIEAVSKTTNLLFDAAKLFAPSREAL